MSLASPVSDLRDRAGLENTPPYRQLICTFDEGPVRKSLHSKLIRRGAICMQIAKFADVHLSSSVGEVTTIYALILEPTGSVPNHFKRIGIAEIPEESGMADAWDTRTITLV